MNDKIDIHKLCAWVQPLGKYVRINGFCFDDNDNTITLFYDESPIKTFKQSEVSIEFVI